MIKNPKGWYESYYAPDGKIGYCAECKSADENNQPWPENPSFNTPAPAGDPQYNPYLNPEGDLDKHLVQYERYCKTKLGGEDECGYPKERWPEGTPEGTPEDKPHKCSDGCKFVPTKGVSKYEVFAIGGGGAPGSAVKQKPDGTYRNSVKGAATNPTAVKGAADKGENEGTEPEDVVDSSTLFIDLAKVGDTQGKTLDEDDPQSYPLYEKNGNENATDKRGKEYYNRYYLFTRIPGAYNQNQAPIYTLMPEWVKLGKKEENPHYKTLDLPIDAARAF